MQVAARTCLWRETPGRSRTAFSLTASEAKSMTAKIGAGVFAPGSTKCVVDWGDGERTVRTRSWSVGTLTHLYAEPGVYKVTVSDDLRTFALGWTGAGNVYHDMYAGHPFISLGSQVRTIPAYGFAYLTLPGPLELPGVTSVGQSAFGGLSGCTDLILPSLERLDSLAFRWHRGCPLLHCDKAKEIGADFFSDGTYTYVNYTDVFLRESTCAEILAMSGFPFGASWTVRFHGSDGIVNGNGDVTPN